MEAEILQFIQSHPSSAYLAVFGVLLACGLGVPLPEDVTLVAGGYMVYQSQVHQLGQPTLIPMIAVGMAGVLVGDVILFLVGRWMGPRVTRKWPFRRLVTERRMERIYRFFARYGAWTAFFARFAAGLRAPTFLLAGTSRMSFRTFLLADGLAALISVPLLVWSAYRFGHQLDRVKSWLMNAKYGVLLIIAVILVIWLAKRLRAAPQRQTDPRPPAVARETE